MPNTLLSQPAPRQMAEQAFSRAAGAPLVEGNAVELLIDGQAHFDAWLNAIASAKRQVLLENYIIRNDAIGRAILSALVERARAGIRVCVLRDWMGCFGVSTSGFWKPLLAAGGEARVYGPPNPLRPLTFASRDHRKMLVVDDSIGFVSGVCISAKWLGRPKHNVAPWRDTGVTMRGPVLASLQEAFADNWALLGEPLPGDTVANESTIAAVGDVPLRLIATRPNVAHVYRLDQLIAAMARKSLWLTDAYFVGIAPYVQALVAASRDGVDVRMLVPGTNDIPVVAGMSRAGYRPLLEAGVRIFEWNGSMLHAKTAVADEQWARVGSSNLNLASWMNNCELDVAIEHRGIAEAMHERYEEDLTNATEIVLAPRRRRGGTRVSGPSASGQRGKHRGRGRSGRTAASALRLANTVSAALTSRRLLGHAESAPLAVGAVLLLIVGVIGILWPPVLGWPVAVGALWMALNLTARWWRLRRQASHENDKADTD